MVLKVPNNGQHYFSKLYKFMNHIKVCFKPLKHSLRLNAKDLARAWQILGSLIWRLKIISLVVILFFMCLVRYLQKKWKFFRKSIHLWLCITYYSDRLTLGHVRLLNDFWTHDMWKVTGDTWQVTPDMWDMKHDSWGEVNIP